jgi:hypothetical protein
MRYAICNKTNENDDMNNGKENEKWNVVGEER